MLEFFLIAGGVLACFVALPFLCGMLLAMLVCFTPGLKLKLRIARTLVARPFRWVDHELYLIVYEEVSRTVFSRYGPKETRALFKKVLEMTG